jgi:RNA polymerase sigma-70 factor (ECF subfamily)
VYQTYANTVARWAARLGGPGVEVEDITQEVFLIVNRRLPEFRHDSRLATWLFSITAKVVANDRRRRRVRAWWLRIVPHLEDRSTTGPDTPIEHLEKGQRRARFYAVLDRLSERQRRVLVLFELEDMPVVEIAELMRLRTGNVRVLLHRARAAFLTRMTECESQEALEWGETARRGNSR